MFAALAAVCIISWTVATVTKLSRVPVGGGNKVSNPTAIYIRAGGGQKETKKPLIKLPDYNCFVIPAGEFLLALPFHHATPPYIYTCFSLSLCSEKKLSPRPERRGGSKKYFLSRSVPFSFPSSFFFSVSHRLLFLSTAHP